MSRDTKSISRGLRWDQQRAYSLTDCLSRPSASLGNVEKARKKKQQKRAADAFVTFTYLYNVVLRFVLSEVKMMSIKRFSEIHKVVPIKMIPVKKLPKTLSAESYLVHCIIRILMFRLSGLS